MTEHLRIRTASGSTYEVDGCIWQRTVVAADSGPLRTEGGTLLFYVVPEVGRPLTIVCEPISDGSTARVITTSPVVEVVRLDDEQASHGA